jgi:hypothetical protein
MEWLKTGENGYFLAVQVGNGCRGKEAHQLGAKFTSNGIGNVPEGF